MPHDPSPRTGADRSHLIRLEQLPNVGRATAEDLRLIGIRKPADLIGKDPKALYDLLCAATSTRHDPCILDVFTSVVEYMEGAPVQPWWAYTTERLQRHPCL